MKISGSEALATECGGVFGNYISILLHFLAVEPRMITEEDVIRLELMKDAQQGGGEERC